MTLQRAAGNSAVAGVLAQSGNPLEPDVRADMESRFGHDFGDVRVHTDASAGDSARAIDANAYTAGTHVVFQREAYAPNTDAGRRTLAHELTHVLQQKAGPVDGTPTSEGFNLSHPDDRFEREAVTTAEAVMTTGRIPAPLRQAGANPHLQRVGHGSRGTIQRSPVVLETPGESGNIQVTAWGNLFHENRTRELQHREFAGPECNLDVPAGRRLLVQFYISAVLPGGGGAQHAWVEGWVTADQYTGAFRFEEAQLVHVDGSPANARFALDRGAFSPQVSSSDGTIRLTTLFSARATQRTDTTERSGQFQFETPRVNVTVPRRIPIVGGQQVPVVPRGQATVGGNTSTAIQVSDPHTSPSCDFVLRLHATNLRPIPGRRQSAPRAPIYLHTHDLRRTVHFGRSGLVVPIDTAQIRNLTQWIEQLEGNEDDPSNLWNALTKDGLRINVRAYASVSERRARANIRVAEQRLDWAVHTLRASIPNVQLAPGARPYSTRIAPVDEPHDWRVDIWIIEREALDIISSRLARQGRAPQYAP